MPGPVCRAWPGWIALSAALLLMGCSTAAPPTSTTAGLPASASPATAPPGLRGTRMGITRPGTLTSAAARQALREWGLKPDEDVALVSFNEVPAILSAMGAGAADAGVLTEPTSFRAEQQGLVLLVDL